MIDKDGNVGIGNNPIKNLTIASGSDCAVSIGKWDEDTTNDTAGIWFSSTSSHTYNITQHTPHIYSFKSHVDDILTFTSYGGHEFKYIENADTGQARNHNGTDTVAMKITNTGRVGIGIGNLDPSSVLHIYGEIDQATAARAIAKGIHLGMENNSKDPTINLCSDTFSYSRIRFSTNYNWYPRGMIQYNHSQERMQFFVNNNTEALRLMSDGDIFAPFNVGIGTSSPSTSLDIKTTSTGHGIFIRNSDNTEAASLKTAYDGSGYLRLMKNSTTLGALIRGNNSSYFNGGNVGIGTTSPTSAKLNVHAATHSSEENLQAWSYFNGSERSLLLKAPSTGGDHTNNPFIFATNNAIKFTIDDDDALCIDAAGKVGINTNTPNYILEVNSTNAIKIPKGTTAQRPGTVTDGLIRYNSTNNEFEGYGNSVGKFGWCNNSNQTNKNNSK